MYAGVVLHHETKQTFHQSEMKFKGWIKSYLLLTVRSWHFYLIASENLLVSWKIFTQGPPQDPGNVGSLDHMFFGWWIRSTPAQYASGQSTAGPRIHHHIVRSLSRMRSCSNLQTRLAPGSHCAEATGSHQLRKNCRQLSAHGLP